jgi:hypothetical protein
MFDSKIFFCGVVCRRKEVKIFGYVGRMCVRKKNEGGLGEKDLKWYNFSLLSGGVEVGRFSVEKSVGKQVTVGWGEALCQLRGGQIIYLVERFGSLGVE